MAKSTKTGTGKKRGNPNFVLGNRLGAAPLSEGEQTVTIAGRLPESLKAQFDALPGTASQKLRQAVELLLQHQQSQNIPDPEASAETTVFAPVIQENNLLVLGATQTLSLQQWQQIVQNERQERIDRFLFGTIDASGS